MTDVATEGAEIKQEAGTAGAGTAGAETAGPETAAPVPAASEPATVVGGPPKLSRRTVHILVAAVVGLLLLTVVINRVASSASSPSTTTQTPRVRPVVEGTVPPVDTNQLHAPLRSLLDLTSLHGQRPKPFALTDATTGKTVTLSSLAGHVVVLTFADANCKDICPVLAAELHAAAADLGKTTVPVSFVTVNTDPLATAPKEAAILHQPLFASLPGWMFLTGSVHELDPVWTDYGISITADPATGVASHNDFLYFISSEGKLVWSALPFADQSPDGSFSLAKQVIDRFGAGIARYAAELAK